MSRVTALAPPLLRGFAIVLALAAAIDPAVTSNRTTKPEVAVVAADSSADGALADRVAHDLGDAFTVVPAAFAGAAGTVVVGDRLPSSADELASPAFAVIPDRDGPTVTIENVNAPSRAPLEARVPIMTTVRVTGASGRTLDLTLRMGGLVVDRVTRKLGTSATADSELRQLPLTFVPTASGVVPLRVTAEIEGVPHSASSDLIVDVRAQRWSVLFFDPRPSWMSTFVRRAIERDPRFMVTSRVITSRNISTDAGQPPQALDELAPVALFDAIVVGAPEALTERDVAGLGAFLRRRAGGVLLLFDQRTDGPYERLTEVGQWKGTTSSTSEPVTPTENGSGGLRASEIAWPSRLPDGAEVLARSVPTSGAGKGDTSQSRAIVWRSPVGAGRLVVSGALDAWRYRDSSTSSFDSFWQTVLAETADAGAPPIIIHVSKPLLAPGELTDVTVTLRDAALADASSGTPIHASVSAAIESPDHREVVRLWPDGTVGRFRGSLRAPSTPNAYRLVVSSGGTNADVPIDVATGTSHPAPDERDLVAGWASARGGSAIPASRLGDLSAALTRALRPTSRAETWYPMRSPWWIIPFVLALSGEWLSRRRRGLA